MVSPIIKPNKGQMMRAVRVGGLRALDHIFAPTDTTNYVGDPKYNCWQRDIEGAAAEHAYHIYRNRVWDPGDRHAADVMDGTQIRHTELPNGCLTVKPSDEKNLDEWFILVTGAVGIYRIVGYAKGRDCKRAEWMKEYYGPKSKAWYAPQNFLHKFPDKTVEPWFDPERDRR